MNSELIRVGAALLLVLGIIFILSWLVKRLNGVTLSASKGFHSIASMALGPKERLMLVQVGGQYLLMGVGAGAVSMLYDFGKELPEGFDSENKSSFAVLLKSAVGKS